MLLDVRRTVRRLQPGASPTPAVTRERHIGCSKFHAMCTLRGKIIRAILRPKGGWKEGPEAVLELNFYF
ncbi:hypothetical protein ebA4967 [Aromatoleum aromaticum EbN1]|uniref:Uncharacterized protein n=1 Tax=Aromatoleum aromaticum (strain DSM 19018 / LMG 30748 / EbN1) TaxID=76114 RepID=Q5P163_AROAE|nr:hypothetical protein ebA4967 [Aromatoleum aromaticum EbN1]